MTTAAGKTPPNMDAAYVEALLTCPISFERMQDPVVLPSGHTYDRQSITASLLKQPYLDPKSGVRAKKPLTYAPNFVVRELLQDYGAYVPFDDSRFQRGARARGFDMNDHDANAIAFASFTMHALMFYLTKHAITWVVHHVVVEYLETLTVLCALFMARHCVPRDW
jgi:hypothetical protein